MGASDSSLGQCRSQLDTGAELARHSAALCSELEDSGRDRAAGGALWLASSRLLGAVAASRLLRSFLFEVSPFDPGVLALSAIAMLLLALAASALPARRASSTDPMVALRGE